MLRINQKAREFNKLIESSGLHMGLGEGRRLHLLTVPSWGFNSAQVHEFNALLAAGNYQWRSSPGRSQKDGLSRLTVIFAPRPEENKGENDLSQLQD
jgi:hypothetical protein